MIRLFRWLGGYVDFCFTKGFCDGFVNDCFSRELNIHNIIRDGNTIKGECSARTYLRLHRVARNNGGVVEVTARHGILFRLLRLRGRWGIFVGALMFVVIVSFLSGFVWQVEVEGNNRINTDTIIEFLQDNGFGVGVYWNSVDKDVLESLVMASFDDVAWVHINQLGSKALVEINETVKKPELVDNTYITNLKATRDGIIVKATVYDGWAVAKVGDSVTEGSLLISGVYENEDTKVNLFAHARGEYIAQVTDDFSLTISRQQSSRVYEEERKYRVITFFGLRIPLYIGRPSSFHCEVTTDSSYITLNDRELPIGIITTTAVPYSVTSRVLDDKELTELMNEEIERKLKKDYPSSEIVTSDIDISLNSDEAVAKGRITLLEDIGAEIKMGKMK